MSMQQQIEAKLAAALSPSHLEVINESYMHRVAPGSESHFKVVVVSQAFEGQRLLGRHRQVNGVLADELAGAIHALALHTIRDSAVNGPRKAPSEGPTAHAKGDLLTQPGVFGACSRACHSDSV